MLRTKTFLVGLFDYIIVICAYYLAILLRFDFDIETANISLSYLTSVIFYIVLIYCTSFYAFGVNKSLWRYFSVVEAMTVVIASFSGSFFVYIFDYYNPNIIIPRSSIIIATILIVSGSLGIRIAYRYYRLRQRQTKEYSNSLIVGAGEAGNILLKELLSNPLYKSKVVGFIDDGIHMKGRRIGGVPVLGTTDELQRLVVDNDITRLFVAIPSATKSQLREILSKCNNCGIKTNIMGISNVENITKSEIRDVAIEDLLSRGEVVFENSEISSEIKDKVVMVTGGGGSIGSELCRQIVTFKPKKLICFDIYENNMYSLEQEFNMKKRLGTLNNDTELVFLIGSVRDYERLDIVMKTHKPDIVYHAAAHKHVPLVETSPKEAIKNNVFGTHNTIKSCINNSVRKFILISTDKAVRPTNVMGATKRLCEMIIQAYRDNGVTKVGAVRFGNVLGSNGSVIPLFKNQIKNGGPVTLTHPDITRYFMTIPEAVQLVLQAGSYANKGDIFVLDMGDPVKIKDLAENLIKLSGLKLGEDIQIEYIGLRPGEKMYEELSLGDEVRYKTPNDLIFVNEPMDIKLKEVLDKIDSLEKFCDTVSDDKINNKIMKII